MPNMTLEDSMHRIIGYLEIDGRGNKTLRDPHHKILGYYEAGRNVTMDFTHRIVGYGDILASLLNR